MLAIFNDHSRVVAAAFAFFRVADDEDNALDPAGQIIQCQAAGPIEIGTQQQVFRRIAA
ncbi:hypothetical protein D3C86_2143040 [compost metagenome]